MRKNFRMILLLMAITTAVWTLTGCGDKEQAGDMSQKLLIQLQALQKN